VSHWRAGGTPKTHLVPLFCNMGKLSVVTKHVLSDALTFAIQERQVTSLCGVSPILHRIKKYSYGVYGVREKSGDIPLTDSLRPAAARAGILKDDTKSFQNLPSKPQQIRHKQKNQHTVLVINRYKLLICVGISAVLCYNYSNAPCTYCE